MKQYLSKIFILISFSSLLFFSSCSTSPEEKFSLFESIPIEHSNIEFENNLNSDSDFNVYKYRNFYNGGGVAIGDVNQDSLPDVYLTSNRGSNKLYINKGDFVFEDVTEEAGVSGTKPWTTGVSFVDINGDGLLDIYVTNSGEFETDKRRNELFINNGDLSADQQVPAFTESAAEYGLNHPGYSIHASFFDFDGDSDLDMYLLNNSDASTIDFDLDLNHRDNPDELGGDKLFRNDGGSFTDVTREAGILSPEIAFGLSASVSDLNRDGHPDIYVANDFFEYDYLYMNNGDGTFDEVLKQQINSISAASMGTDIADLTNNGWPDIYATDMLPLTDQRTKQITTYENWELFSEKESQGYHYQLTRNTLQLNNGNGTYSEVGRLAGVQASDWSWATLIADFDLNGYSDILVTNGLIQDITNLDYIEEINRPDMVRSIIQDDNVDFEKLVDMIPSNPVPNVLFANYGNLEFQNKAGEWGLGEPGYSSGAAWADFDNDGDLDIIINDVNGPAKLYRNQAVQEAGENWLKVTLEGESPNRYAIGTTTEVWADSSYWYREHYLQRGYQSSVEPGIYIGLGDHQTVDSLRVQWPDGRTSFQTDLQASQTITLRQSNASVSDTQLYNQPAYLTGDIDPSQSFDEPLVTDITAQVNLDWSHQENPYIDFNREPLLLHMRSTEGPALCSGDVNNDGLSDFYIGGARDQQGVLVLQTQNGSFSKQTTPAFNEDAISEDTDCAFFDPDGDGDQDLFVTSGGNSFSTGASALFDKLYMNTGNGVFEKNESLLPTGGFSSNSTVSVADFNDDGASDLFVGERLRAFSYGMSVRGFILINDGEGNFSEESTLWNPNFGELGMITDSAILDWDGDGRQDLAVTGEWMPIRIFRNTGSSFEEITNEAGLSETKGLWNALHVADINQDGRDDLIAGNLGLNTHFKTSREAPLKMWIRDFENDGIPEQILTRSINGEDKPFVLKHDLLNQISSLQSKYPEYSDYADQSIRDIFPAETLDQALVLQADILESIAVLNTESGSEINNLPLRSQFSPVYGIWNGDLSGDGSTHLIIVGNLYEVKPMAGQYDASYGTVLTSDLKSIPEKISGFSVRGSGRRVISVENSNGKTILVIARNNASPLFFQIN